MIGGILRYHRPALIRREGPSIRQARKLLLPAISGPMFKGSVAEVADLMEEWWRNEAGNGFTAMAPVQPRGLRPPGYRGATLRENMGLHRPPDPWSSLPAPGYVGG